MGLDGGLGISAGGVGATPLLDWEISSLPPPQPTVENIIITESINALRITQTPR